MKKHLFIAGIERLYSKTTKNIIFLIHSKYPKFVQGTFQGTSLFQNNQTYGRHLSKYTRKSRGGCFSKKL